MNENGRQLTSEELIKYIAVPLVLGAIVGLITKNQSSNYDGIVPGFVFPIVWSILYILMGISSYIVRDDKELMNIYKVNLGINILWPIIFFSLKLRVLAFFWILILILVVGYMIYRFYNKNKISAYLLIPYILWLVFASVLNLIEIV